MASLQDLVVRIQAARAGADDPPPPPPSHDELPDHEAIDLLVKTLRRSTSGSSVHELLRAKGVVLARRA